MAPGKRATDLRAAARRALLVMAALPLAACADAQPPRPRQTGPIALFTSLPLVWSESADLRGLLRSDAPVHWALAALRRHGEVRPLDSFIAAGDSGALDRFGYLVMAQPRALAPQENLALDSWVRSGGRLLLFADPLLTEESAFPLGDRRRPEGTVLLSPILDHWKLQLLFDEDQPPGENEVDLAGHAIPVNLPGRFVVAPGSRHCTLLAGGIAALCRLGKGHVLLVADAALLEQSGGDSASQRAAGLEALLEQLAGAR